MRKITGIGLALLTFLLSSCSKSQNDMPQWIKKNNGDINIAIENSIWNNNTVEIDLYLVGGNKTKFINKNDNMRYYHKENTITSSGENIKKEFYREYVFNGEDKYIYKDEVNNKWIVRTLESDDIFMNDDYEEYIQYFSIDYLKYAKCEVLTKHYFKCVDSEHIYNVTIDDYYITKVDYEWEVHEDGGYDDVSHSGKVSMLFSNFFTTKIELPKYTL